MRNITILIPIYNRLKITKKGIRSLYEALNYYNNFGKASIKYSVVVIDDGSSDGSAEWISSYNQNIQVLKGNGNLWWTGSITKGADYAIKNLKSDHLLLWNDDVFPNLDYFVTLETISNDCLTDNTIIGSKIVFKDAPNKIWCVGGYFNKFSGHFYMKTKIEGNENKIIECDWQPGMGTLVPVSKIESLCLRWDGINFPQYHGDSDFTLRCNSKGIRIVTHLDLILNNNIETTGFGKKENLKDLFKNFTSLKSNYNLKINFKFYSRHGYFPFAYFGMLSKYFFFIGGYVKNSLFKLKTISNLNDAESKTDSKFEQLR